MNDDFLYQLREPPRPEFADALYRRISQPKPTPLSSFLAPKRLAFASLILFLALGLLLALSPDVRAQVGDVIKRIGVFSFKETDQFPEIRKNTIYLHGELVSLEQAKTMVSYTLRIPTWVPAGFIVDKDVRVTKDEDVGGTRIFVPAVPVTITWRRGQGIPIALTQQLANGPVGPGQVGPGSVEEVKVHGEPAALVRGVWNAQTQTWSQSSQTLFWRKDGIDYSLDAPLDITTNDLVRIAESLQ
jgi:hypothetical protein